MSFFLIFLYVSQINIYDSFVHFDLYVSSALNETMSIRLGGTTPVFKPMRTYESKYCIEITL